MGLIEDYLRAIRHLNPEPLTRLAGRPDADQITKEVTTMTESEARKILGEAVQPDDSLDNLSRHGGTKRPPSKIHPLVMQDEADRKALADEQG